MTKLTVNDLLNLIRARDILIEDLNQRVGVLEDERFRR